MIHILIMEIYEKGLSNEEFEATKFTYEPVPTVPVDDVIGKLAGNM